MVRHAKAERDSPRGDHGRHLNQKGLAQAAALRAWTEDGGVLGDLRATVVVSDAARTLETFERGLAGSPMCLRAIVDPLLYNGAREVDTDEVLAALAAVDTGEGDLGVVGHNPTVAYVVSDLCEDPAVAAAAMRDGYPLCAVAILSFETATPQPGACHLEFFAAPQLPD